MTVDLAFPTLPPALDGIGDHTARLAAALAPHAAVRVLTAEPAPAPIPDVEVARVFERPGRLGGLAGAVVSGRPDWLVVPYNPFSWGRRGWAPGLVRAVGEARRRAPGLRVALLVHEPFTPLRPPTLAAMSAWQRPQFWALGRAADLVLTSIEAWADRFRPWFPRATVAHLPVGSNIADAGVPRDAARAALGLKDGPVLGLFGKGSQACLGHVRAAAEAIPGATVLYVGTRGGGVAEALGGLLHRDLGPLPAPEVSRAFSAFDVLLAPYPDGATTRRGTLMAGLAHGVPVASTDGALTGPALRAAAPGALRLAPPADAAAFARVAAALAADPGGVGARGRALYRERFDWPVLAARLADLLAR